MYGEVIAIEGDYPKVQLEDGRCIYADYLQGDQWRVGDKVFVQDVSSLPEDPGHWLITDFRI